MSSRGYARGGKAHGPQPPPNAPTAPSSMRQGPNWGVDDNGHGESGQRGRGGQTLYYNGNGVSYVGPTRNSYLDIPQPPAAAEAKPETPKKPLVSEAMRIKILDLMTEHGDEYDPTADEPFFDKIATLVEQRFGLKGLTGPDIKTRAHLASVCRDRRAPGAKMDPGSDLERAADRWIDVSSALGQGRAVATKAKHLDSRTVDSLLHAAIGTLETHHAVLSSPDAARTDWQQAEVVMGFPLIMSANPAFLTTKQMDAILQHNRNSAALIQASNGHGRTTRHTPGDTPHHAFGPLEGIASAVQVSSPPNHGAAAGNGEGSSRTRPRLPVVEGFTSSPPPRPEAPVMGNESYCRKPVKQRLQEAAKPHAARESTADVHEKQWEDVYTAAMGAAKLKREMSKEAAKPHAARESTADVHHKQWEDIYTVAMGAAKLKREMSEEGEEQPSSPSSSEEEEEGEDEAPPPKKKKKLSEKQCDDESMNDERRIKRERKEKKKEKRDRKQKLLQ
ncbi:hypothetical protein RB593_010058 [Gaeumannomyces tritici]